MNRGGVAGPHGKAWAPSTIYGNWRRGTGILNNELYVGRLIWNRQRFVKDPATGRRLARLNPASEWLVEAGPHLRIVDQELWDAVKARQRAVREVAAPGLAARRPGDTRRPRYLFSGLVKCGACGSGFTTISRHHMGCAGARDRGICGNRLTIRREMLERSVLQGLQTHLMRPELVKAFIAEFQAELRRLALEARRAAAAAEAELREVERQIRAIIEAIKGGIRTPTMREELVALEERKLELGRRVAAAAPPTPAIHPGIAEIYRRKVAALYSALNDDGSREEAAETLRALIEEVRLVPEGGTLAIELHGELGAILRLANENPRPAFRTGVQTKLVAGARNHRESFRLCTPV